MYLVEAIEVFVVALQKFINLLVGHVLVVQVLQSAVRVVGVFFEAVVSGGRGCHVGRITFGAVSVLDKVLPQDVIFSAVRCIGDAALLERLDDDSWVKLFPCTVHPGTDI